MLGIKRRYMGWDEYKTKLDFLDSFLWQQRIRRNNMRTQQTFTA